MGMTGGAVVVRWSTTVAACVGQAHVKEEMETLGISWKCHNSWMVAEE